MQKTLAPFEKALQTNESLIGLPDATAEDWRETARAHQRIGHTLQSSVFYDANSTEEPANRFEQARPKSLTHHDRAIEIFARLAADAPDNARAVRDHADALLMRAEIKARAGAIESATGDCRTAISTLETLLAADEKNQELRYDVAMAYYQTSNVFQNVSKDNRRGAQMMTRAVGMLESIVAANRSHQQSLGDLLSGSARMREMTAALGNAPQAEIYLEKFIKCIRMRFAEEKDLAGEFLGNSARVTDDVRGFKNAASARINLRAAKEFLRLAVETNQNLPDSALKREIERAGKLIDCREQSLKNRQPENFYASCSQAM